MAAPRAAAWARCGHCPVAGARKGDSRCDARTSAWGNTCAGHPHRLLLTMSGIAGGSRYPVGSPRAGAPVSPQMRMKISSRASFSRTRSRAEGAFSQRLRVGCESERIAQLLIDDDLQRRIMEGGRCRWRLRSRRRSGRCVAATNIRGTRMVVNEFHCSCFGDGSMNCTSRILH